MGEAFNTSGELDCVRQLPPASRRRCAAAVARGEQLVYFVQAIDGGPIKIGVARNPDARVRDLQVGSPVRLVVRFVKTGGVAEERRLQHRFRETRLWGEWFAATSELQRISRGLGGRDSAEEAAYTRGHIAGLRQGREDSSDLILDLTDELAELREDQELLDG